VRLSVLNVILIVTLVFGAAVTSAYLIYRALSADEKAESASRPALLSVQPIGPTVDLGTFTVNLAEGNRYLRSEIVIEVTERQSAQEIEARMPQVRDSVIAIIRKYSAEELSNPDSDRPLKDEIAEALTGLLTRGRVVGVYFTSWVIQ